MDSAGPVAAQLDRNWPNSRAANQIAHVGKQCRHIIALAQSNLRSIACSKLRQVYKPRPSLVALHSIAMYRTAFRTVRAVRPANAPVLQQRCRGGVVDSTKEVLKDINLKVGKTLASGLDKAEDVAETVKEEVSTVKDKAGDKKNDLSQKASQEAAELKDTLQSNKDHVQREVKENFKGYDSLQDKGSKIEREQQRPDDGV
ncbi:hypothetical protein KL932_003081 [Ogataea haglerorum]|uniref:uncharacterized protein n=1 Tax=Ogataea haglerorum TaxID=1937702 RepID=UPI001C8A6757|nr:uncharacterized protein KL911_002329 [Ogataea haglerorum]KAG7739818.1 hypothetical protein KL932_003081 [Ogataea haglerorum]KAG7747901.1 hypothetical protein KL912_002578 [Ogataea haglerorum]KAG7753853.1 hypothetical protein KL911_002329 [Ogataea haglerorum]